MRVHSASESTRCVHCNGQVVPSLRFYRRTPDAFVCPQCGKPFHRFSNEARRQDRLLIATLSIASFFALLGMLLH